MKGYIIIDENILEKHIRFLRIKPTDIKITLKNILDSLMNLSWLSCFDKEFLKSSYEERAKQTINYIEKNIITKSASAVSSSSGEYIVSELARLSVIEKYSYLDIPLAELFKKKVIGNHGFDFYTSNTAEHILFGEAKYIKSQSAYGSALKQVNKFFGLKQHITDIADIQNFFSDKSFEKCHKNEIGFMIAFSTSDLETHTLLANIKKNADFKKMKVFKEIILIAVDI